MNIRQHLPLTATYIQRVIDTTGQQRSAHHNWVVKQRMMSSKIAITSMTTSQLKAFDEKTAEHLRYIDADEHPSNYTHANN